MHLRTIHSLLLLIKCCSVVFGITMRLLIINIMSSCKLHHLLPATSVTTCHGPAALCWWHLACCSVDNTCCSQILVGNRNYYLPRAPPPTFDAPIRGFPSEYCHDMWYKKSWMVWLPDGSNNWETVEDRWVHAPRGLASTELSFHSRNVLRDCHKDVPRANKKMTIFCNCGSNNWETVVDRQLTH